METTVSAVYPSTQIISFLTQFVHTSSQSISMRPKIRKFSRDEFIKAVDRDLVPGDFFKVVSHNREPYSFSNPVGILSQDGYEEAGVGWALP